MAPAVIAAAKSSPSPFNIADLGRAERLVKKGEEVLARQKELVEHCRARGQGEESAIRLLEDLEVTLCDMIEYRDLVRTHVMHRPRGLQ